MNKPLAIKLKPKSLSDVVGQTHLIGDNKNVIVVFVYLAAQIGVVL